MQPDIDYTDITAINIQLNELRSKFDLAMREEHDFQDLREIYLQIKELECYLNALNWAPDNKIIMQHPSVASSWMY